MSCGYDESMALSKLIASLRKAVRPSDHRHSADLVTFEIVPVVSGTDRRRRWAGICSAKAATRPAMPLYLVFDKLYPHRGCIELGWSSASAACSMDRAGVALLT
jgi:hypothetical protein